MAIIEIKDNKGITAKKNQDFSEWYTQVVQKAELADLRYNIKGFLVFQPWSVIAMEKMFSYLGKNLESKGHKPYFFPTVIPESNFKRESDHIKGFTPEVFWVTGAGEDTFQEKMALRPTSETAFYQMFSIWIRSYKDLPFKTYQRANVFRYETKATRPFLRSREFHWIEAHCAHRTKEDAMKQVYEDMQTTKEVLHDIFGLPFMFFERPSWDKFAGAEKTFAADVLNPDGRVVQQPSTHLLKQNFSEGFNVKYKDSDGQDKYVWITCYGPAVSRIFASIVIVHGDDKGLRMPWNISPVQVVIVPIVNDARVLVKCDEVKKQLDKFATVEIDLSEKSAGEKFNHWEMKGVPIRIDIGLKDIDGKKLTVFRRDNNKKEQISEKDVLNYVKETSEEYSNNLVKQADGLFNNRIKDAIDKKDIKKVIDSGMIARVNFCSVEKDGESCATAIEKECSAQVRGTLLTKEKAKGVCAICGREAKEVVYVARSY